MATITTIKASVEAAQHLIDLATQSSYIAIGRPDAWDRDNSPPLPEKDVDTLDNLIGLKKVDNLSLVTPISKEEAENTVNKVQFDGMYWKLVSVEEAVEEEAYYIYFNATIDDSHFGDVEYRQVGIYIGTEANEDVTDTESLEPREVSDLGTLYFLSNRVPQQVQNGIKSSETFIVTTLPRQF